MDVDGTRLETYTDGSGEPVVLVHGSASDHRTWRNQRYAFSKRFRVLAYSRRFHWPNEPIREGDEYSMEVHVEDLRGLLHSSGSGPFHLVGHSYGAFLCLLVAIREPELVRTLVLAEPPVVSLYVSDPPKPLELLRLLATQPRLFAAVLRFGLKGLEPARKAFRAGDDWAGVRIFGRAVFGPSGYDELPAPLKEQVRDNLSDIRAEILGPGLSPLRPEDVRGVRIPALLVGGEHSIELFRLLLDRLEDLMPASQRVMIAEAGHAIQEDNPEAFNAEALSFLGVHRSSQFEK